MNRKIFFRGVFGTSILSARSSAIRVAELISIPHRSIRRPTMTWHRVSQIAGLSIDNGLPVPFTSIAMASPAGSPPILRGYC